MDISQTTAPKSDQQNFDDYVAGPKTVTISEVRAGTAEQPVEVHLVEFPDRPFKPSKSMRRVLVAAWGAESSTYTGRRMTLFGDPTVKFGGAVTGGIRISHLSHIDKGITLALTTTRGKRAPYHVDPLPAATPAGKSFAQQVTDAVAHYEAAFNVNQDDLERFLGATADKWTAADLTTLRGLSGQLKSGEKTVDDVFPQQPTLDGAA